jgi:hypothetical protein
MNLTRFPPKSTARGKSLNSYRFDGRRGRGIATLQKNSVPPEITGKILMNEIATQNLILNHLHKGTIQLKSVRRKSWPNESNSNVQQFS